MRRPAPLPVRDGLGPARVRLRGGAVLVELADRFGEDAAAKVLAGEVVCADGAVVTTSTVLPPGGKHAVPARVAHRVTGQGGGPARFAILQGVGKYDFMPVG